MARNMLQGFIDLKEGRRDSAITAWEKAVQVEENMVYAEPRDWMMSPKQFLGSAYLAAGQWAKAEALFRRDLMVNDGNAWALQGLQQALEGQGNKKEAKKIGDKLSKAIAAGELEKTARVL